ncbi:MAG: response regulator [Bacteroidales bacterium]|nr:response regulator [Bacteroidales bacterium]
MTEILKKIKSSIKLDCNVFTLEERILYYFYVINIVEVSAFFAWMIAAKVELFFAILMLSSGIPMVAAAILTKKQKLRRHHHLGAMIIILFDFIFIFFISDGISGSTHYYIIIFITIISLFYKREFIFLFCLFITLIPIAFYIDWKSPELFSPFINQPNIMFLDRVITFVIISLFGGFITRVIINNFRNARRELEFKNKEIQDLMAREAQLNRYKLDFFTNFAHEFRTPLTLLNAPIDMLLTGDNDLVRKKTYELIKNNTGKLIELTNQVIEFQKLDSGTLFIEKQVFDFCDFIKKLSLSHQPYADWKKVKLATNIKHNPIIVEMDITKIEKAFSSILKHLLDSTLKDNTVKIELERKKNKTKTDLNSTELSESDSNCVVIKIYNTNGGMNITHTQGIINPFYQIPETDLTTGLGLSIANEVIKLHQGTLDIDSKAEIGFCYTIQLPIPKTIDQKKQVAINLTTLSTPSESINSKELQVESKLHAINENFKIERKSKILIIEDNDEMIKLLHELLIEDFHVFIAKNGEDGLKIARKELPDLVLSDIMMPGMDGTQVCRLLKEDMHTSHIPVILLTAKASDISKINGLQLGADDYIYKPFNVLEVRSRILNIIRSREQLRKRFMDEFQVGELFNIASETPDEKFINKAIQVVLNNIDNEKFGTSEFALQMGMSRSIVHTKIKSLTNYKTSEFIASVRMKKASLLLQQKDKTVAEVAFLTGYSDPVYFGKVFKKIYGVSPKKFRDGY